MKQVRYCTRCVMNDESDRTIKFDSEGHCDYCTTALSQINTTAYFPNEVGKEKLDVILNEIKTHNKDKKYDCVMGISGGLDSSYLAYLGHKWGLRILGVHIDDGFDTEISKGNIKRLCDACDIELRTITPDPVQFYDLELAYMKAEVPALDIPQDNVLVAFLYETIKKENLKYFLSGSNFALECILQRDNLFNQMDVVNIKDIHKKYGTQQIDKLRFIDSYHKFMMEKSGTVVTYRLLNYVDYNRDRAFKELSDFCGFEYYGSKHLENVLTAFIQLYWFPKKFHVDKRTSHLSSMIVSGQMTREEALAELEKPMYSEEMMNEYIQILKDKLGISDDEFDKIMNAETHQHEEFKTDKLGDVIHSVIDKKRKKKVDEMRAQND